MLPRAFRPSIAGLLFFWCVSCTGQVQLRTLEHDNALSVEPSTVSDADYVVSLRNLQDIGYDPDNQATRYEIALRALATQCPNAKVTGETIIDTGTYLLGNPSRTYAMRVKCNR